MSRDAEKRFLKKSLKGLFGKRQATFYVHGLPHSQV
jgi:hypothetical protein